MLYKDTDKDTIVQLVLNRDGFESTCSFLRKDCQDTLLRISHGHSDGVSSTVCKFSLDKGHRGGGGENILVRLRGSNKQRMTPSVFPTSTHSILLNSTQF